MELRIRIFDKSRTRSTKRIKKKNRETHMGTAARGVRSLAAPRTRSSSWTDNRSRRNEAVPRDQTEPVEAGFRKSLEDLPSSGLPTPVSFLQRWYSWSGGGHGQENGELGGAGKIRWVFRFWKGREAEDACSVLGGLLAAVNVATENIPCEHTRGVGIGAGRFLFSFSLFFF